MLDYEISHIVNRGTSSGNEFMRKQELIDAAEASGLSRVPIAYVQYGFFLSFFFSFLLSV